MQQVIVAVVVLFAAIAVVRRYAPSAWKTACAALAAKCAKSLGWHALAQRLAARQPAAPDCSSGCATCSGCDLAARTPAGEYVMVIERLKSKK